MIAPFNFREFALEMATTLNAIAHSDSRPRFFTASGPEDMRNVEDRVSSIDGPFLLAVDGCETVTIPTHHDQICHRTTYYLSILQPTTSDRPETIDAAVSACRDLVIQVRNVLWQRYKSVSREVTLFGEGPLADNFYGCGMEFRVDEYPDFFVDPSVFADGGSGDGE